MVWCKLETVPSLGFCEIILCTSVEIDDGLGDLLIDIVSTLL